MSQNETKFFSQEHFPTFYVIGNRKIYPQKNHNRVLRKVARVVQYR